MIGRFWQRLSWYVALLAVALDFTISANLLTLLGSRYMSEGGTVFEKIHPGSILAVIAGLLALFHRRLTTNAGGLYFGLLPRYTSGIVLCGLYALIFTGPDNLALLIDTFFSAGMIAMAFQNAPDSIRAQLRFLIQSLLILNALISLLEFCLQAHFIPITIVTDQLDPEFRSTALYDHPLAGAAITMTGLWLRPNFARRPVISLTYVVILAAALVAFGERIPIGLSILAATGSTLYVGWTRILRHQFHVRSFAVMSAVPLLLLGMVGAALSAGMSFRLADHLYWDASAQVRLAEFQILGSFTITEILFGCTRVDILALIEKLRLSYNVGVIENFWLMMLVTLGALFFPVFIAAFSSFIIWLWRGTTKAGRVMVFVFLAAISCSNSLGHKSTILAMFAACVIAASHERQFTVKNWSVLYTV